MENIQLEGRTLERYNGRNVDIAQAILLRWERGEGFIPSEADIRLLGLGNSLNIAIHSWNTSTLSATKGETVKVILPYETGSMTLTEAARLGLGLINLNESLVDYGVNLDIEGRWEKLEGSGVYTRQRDEWFEKGENGVSVGLNSNMTKEQAMKCPLLLTKLGHPDYIDAKFARSAEEVAEVIGQTFESGKKVYDYDIMMGQYLPDISDKGVLKTWAVGWLGDGSCSVTGVNLGYTGSHFAFYSFRDAIINAEGIDVDRARAQLRTLEGILKPEQIDQIGAALNERDKLRDELLEVRKILDGLTRR